MCEQEQFNALEQRVDNVENRLTKVETSLSDFRCEMQTGFSQLDRHLSNLYSEKQKWGEWARNSLNSVGKYLAKWGTVVLFASLGVAWGMSAAGKFFGK